MNGIIPLYKPKGITSADCVYRLRKILHERKIGHTGTLDPDVDGVLVICVGQATKLVNHLMQSPKTYQGQITLGQATTTEDASGDVVAQEILKEPFTTEQIVKAMKALTGKIKQTPPLYSAVRVNGKRLYEYARAHESVERPTREVNIYHFEVLNTPTFLADVGKQIIEFEVQCSKGTYIRTLAVQLGELLQVPAHMNQLTRTIGGTFTLKDTVTLEQIEKSFNAGENSFLLSLSAAFKQSKRYDLSNEQWRYVQNGRSLKLTVSDSQLALFYKGVLKAIYQQQNELYVPQLMLLKNDR
ncbi:tRNA pseudouridine(55) synthase TruB [Bombilactobacillus bombi]|uniref:tRNA pseudouridine(55) synthase TruB n=1 Tax=Bombilactobacillus bombi TaxID=1303590 RepID=UPI000E57093C|nr:tRNA pseudouridine(55) synthase TruB [Bombilactobacillus bombi]